ncbi:SMP-30/Gluconolaconase/LRE-like region [Roseimaritima multifibrata]|uniref:SMP-30/Gluconolaconase/LRE-like region n=1 Tax=Roseimaritima multifibrata TaxID=1930274 RepID=A0A517MDP7_9BACT|nr:SMP-30/gluconolactonase/LRE family protein [Roseimaritima multifibrata]QDS93009.1 SMP-30/Gluconolaconase/LRE-like region [Roseimaritima multifibrata]
MTDPNQITATRLYRSPDPKMRFLPEGPYPLGEGRFSWVSIQLGGDSKEGALNVLDLESGNHRSHRLPGRPGFAFPCDDQKHFIVGCERQIGLFNPVDGIWSPLVAAIDSAVDNTIVNDGVVFEDNLLFGMKDLEFATKKAGLYLFRGSDRKLIQLRDDQICSNGKAVVREGENVWLYDIDSPTREIVRYRLDIEAGKVSERTVVVDLTADPAVPDGMILTPDGQSLIVAMFHPGQPEFGQTRQYGLKTGQLERTWKTPGSPQNTCPNLVANQGKVYLVITTAAEHMSPEQLAAAPEAGSLFVAETDFESTGSVPEYPTPALDDPAM